MNVYLVSLGCARNQVDSETMLGRLQQAGWQVVSRPDDADAIIVNTCSFIEAAADESVETILALSHYKTRGHCRHLIVCGCLPQRYGPPVAEALPEVDAFLGTGAFDRIPDVLAVQPGSRSVCLPDPAVVSPAPPPPRVALGPTHYAYLKIAEGCDRHCAYCIIPRLRGPQKSRPLVEIEAEARQLVENGARELVLIAQETTRYGYDLEPPTTLAGLLQTLADVDPQVWLRFMYGHPQSLTPALLETVSRFPNICAYFDLPVQHAAPAVLADMRRRYDDRLLKDQVALIRQTLPAAVLRTTVITGFPGESDADFEFLLDFIKTVRFDHLGAFAYSDSEDLASFALAPKVEPAVAEARRERLMACQKAISTEINAERHLGRCYDCLIDEVSGPGVYLGRTWFQAPEVDGLTFIETDRAADFRPGDRVRMQIRDSLEYDLIGDIVSGTPKHG